MYIITCFMYKGVAVLITDTGYFWFGYNKLGEVRFSCSRNFNDVEEFV